MSYPTIATILHGRSRVCSAIAAASKVAHRWDAHLHVLCLGGVAQGTCRAGVQHGHDEAAALEKNVSMRLASAKIRWDICTAAVPCDRIGQVVADRMRFHDLVILPSLAKTSLPALDREILKGCITAARRPVLVLPAGGAQTGFDKVQLGWNDGTAAMAAARAALPLMRSARKADIVLVDPKRDTADRSDPGGRLSVYLANHGVRSEIYLLAPSEGGVAQRLLTRARARRADVIILGARDLWHGVCPDVLRTADIPVFLAV